MKKQIGLKFYRPRPLSASQKQILDLLSKEYMSPVKIANLKGISLNAVYKTINILKKKGVFNTQIKMGLKSRCGNRGSTHLGTMSKNIRLHAQEFNIKLLSKTPKYDNTRLKNNVLLIDENTIRLFNNSIEVYSGKHFYGVDSQEATAESFIYWNWFFKRLENDLNVLIVKDRYSNINLVKNHYSYINNELAKQCNEEHTKIRIRTTQDNRVWFEIDNSYNLNEAETIHKETAQQDMQKVITPYFNDLRDNDFLLPSQIKEVITTTQNQVLEIGTGLNTLIKLLIPNQDKQETKEEKINIDYLM